ncbi:hypothetical protein [Leifsonia sp. fls2-241-R2A-40a]|uniref:hypothetical protein n=1 Tax=Leifsonia sp. fls2-241-R2A-40a TaxID=3040290 RepID=UPI002550B67A|nr:hypothetical protein [Leifsonia sp. fls2-241-R2A-40a]
MAERRRPMQAQDKLAFLLALVPYLMDRDRVSVAEAAEHFGVDQEQLRDAVRLIAVSGIPGETNAYQPGDLFDIAWDDFEENDQIVLTHQAAIDDSPRFSAREAAALIAGLKYLTALPENAGQDEPEKAALDRVRKMAHAAMLKQVIPANSPAEFPTLKYVTPKGWERHVKEPNGLRILYGEKDITLDVEMTAVKRQFVQAVISRLIEGGWTEAFEEPSADPEKLAEMALAALPSKSPWDKELGPFFDTPSLAKWKGVSRQRLATLRKENRLIGLRSADTAGTILYPRYQFDGRGRLLPHLPEIWPVLTAGYPEWTAAAWLNTPDPDWQDRTAADVLRYGSEDDVALVLREATQQAAGVAAR